MDTLEQWWDYIKTDVVFLKVRYFVRNQSAIRSACKIGNRWTTLEEFIAFLGTKATVVCHRSYDYAPCGNYTIRELPGDMNQFEIAMRISPNSPSVHGPIRGMPCLTAWINGGGSV